MTWQPPIKAKYPLNPRPTPQPNFGSGMGELSLLLNQLTQLKKDLIDTANKKVAEIDAKIAEHEQIVAQATENSAEVARNANKAIQDTEQQAIEHIRTTQKGDPGTPADEEAILERLKTFIPDPIDTKKLSTEILKKVPVLDEKKLTKTILKALPENKASLKIIQEKLEVDPMSVIDKIMALKGKFKLKKENIDGLEQTLTAFNSQLGRGYLHGGGDTVKAGTNVTITTDSSGKKVISATGGGSGTPGGNNKEIQINNAGSFGGSNLEYDSTSNTVTFKGGYYPPTFVMGSQSSNSGYFSGHDATVGNSAGGSLGFRGGNGSGSYAGGYTTFAGGAGGDTGAGGDISFSGGIGGLGGDGTSGSGGNITFTTTGTGTGGSADGTMRFYGKISTALTLSGGATINNTTLTTGRNFTFPDKSGTFAMTSDITGGNSVASNVYAFFIS